MKINNKNEYNDITQNINFGTSRIKIKGNFKSLFNLISAEKWNNYLRDPLACQQKGYVNVSTLN